MRVLLVPRIEETYGGNSLTICPMMLCKSWLGRDDSVRITIPVHEKIADEGRWLSNYGLTPAECERIEILPVSGLGAKPQARKITFGIGSALFRLIGPLKKVTQFADVIVSDGVFASNAAIRTAMQGVWARGYQRTVPLVGWAEWTATESWDSLWNEFHAKAEMWGSLVSDLICWQSIHVQEDYLKCLAKYLSPSENQKIRERAMLVQTGVVCDRIKPKFYDGKKKPVVFWAGYPAQDFEPCVPALLNALRMGVVERVIIVLMGSRGGITLPEPELTQLRGISGVEVHTAMPHAEFLKLLPEADLFAGQYSSVMGTYGIRFGEQCVAGQFPVVSPHIAKVFLTDRDWSDTVFGQKEYPFQVSGTSVDAWTKHVVMAVEALTKFPQLCQIVSEYVREEHDFRKSYGGMFDATKKLVANQIEGTNFAGFDELAEQALSGIHSIGHGDAMDRISKLTEKGVDLQSNAMVPPGFLRWAILRGGFRDVGTFDEPKYIRIDT